MTTKIVYHQRMPFVDCADGIVSAWVAKKVFPDAYLYPCWYLSEEESKDIENYPQFDSGDYVVVVDFSFPSFMIKHWEDIGVKFLIIDHHKGILEDYEDLFKGDITKRVLKSNSSKFIYDLNESGATLTWKYFFGRSSMPIFLEYVRDRDIWSKHLPYTREVYAAMTRLRSRIKGQGKWTDTFQLFDKLADMNWTELLDYLVPIGQPIVEENDKKIQKIVKKQGVQNVIVGGERGLLIKLKKGHESLYSDIAEEIYLTNPKASFVLVEMSDQMKYSLRSDRSNPNSIDVDLLAKKFGGKGHKNAAGFISDKIPYEVLESA